MEISGKHNFMRKWVPALLGIMLLTCESPDQTHEVLIIDSSSKINAHTLKDTVIKAGIPVKNDSLVIDNTRNKKIIQPPSIMVTNTGTTSPDELMRFAQTFIGVPYVWASIDPKTGFDCSGFITYVFSHFKIQVPRSSVDFTTLGKTVPVEEAKSGDFILFTGTNAKETAVGHMGLIVSNSNQVVKFIHATSGKAMSVTISELTERYKKRFVRISRIFPQNE